MTPCTYYNSNTILIAFTCLQCKTIPLTFVRLGLVGVSAIMGPSCSMADKIIGHTHAGNYGSFLQRYGKT